MNRIGGDETRNILTTCSYVPDEVLHAAGLLPFRLRGHGAEETGIGPEHIEVDPGFRFTIQYHVTYKKRFGGQDFSTLKVKDLM